MKNFLILLCVLCYFPLVAEIKVLAFAGSTREESYNKQLVEKASAIARELGATVTLIDLRDFPMPLYDEDLEKKEGMPNNARRFRRLMIESQAVIISTPEYNGSISAVLKNVLDWASRTEDGLGSREAFKGKKFAIMSASPSGGGGVRALIHLRAIIDALGGDVVAKQVAISNVHKVFDEKGSWEKGQTKNELREEIGQLFPITPRQTK